MIIQINTDKNIIGSQELTSSLTALISDELSRFKAQITRLEVHLSDEDGKKNGINNIKCMLEARLENMQPIAVTEQSATNDRAVKGALKKLKTLIETSLGRKQNY
jgi:endonuclease IV